MPCPMDRDRAESQTQQAGAPRGRSKPDTCQGVGRTPLGDPCIMAM
jgi:hypothetical protein